MEVQLIDLLMVPINTERSEISYMYFVRVYKTPVAGLAQSVQRFVTGWTVRGSNPGGGEFFRTHPDRLWGPPSLQYNGYRVFPVGKAAGAWR